jgi:ribulose 1,5-bisphosphate carboxylase large subunit-like protein
MIECVIVVAGVGVEDVVADAEVAAVGHDDVVMQCVGGVVYGGLESCQVEMSAAFEAQYIERASVNEHIAFEQGVMIMLGLEAD